MQKKAVQQREISKYIISDPHICHGEPTFRGTRKLVRDCIEMAATGLTIDELAARADLPREAIVEALHLAAEALHRYYTGRPVVTFQEQERLNASA